ncbi:hypothetical protein GCM10027614_10750 [Micromonospora vulcania]
MAWVINQRASADMPNSQSGADSVGPLVAKMAKRRSGARYASIRHRCCRSRQTAEGSMASP